METQSIVVPVETAIIQPKETTPVPQINDELEDSPLSPSSKEGQLSPLPKEKKDRDSPEEDIIDGFAFLSYSTWNQLQEILDEEEEIKRRKEEEIRRLEELKRKAELEAERIRKQKLVRPTPKKAKRTNKENMNVRETEGEEGLAPISNSTTPGNNATVRLAMATEEALLQPPPTKIPKLEPNDNSYGNANIISEASTTPRKTTPAPLFSPRKTNDTPKQNNDLMTHPIDPGHRPLHPSVALQSQSISSLPGAFPNPLVSHALGFNRSTLSSMAPPSTAFPFLSQFPQLPPSSLSAQLGLPAHLLPGILGGVGGGMIAPGTFGPPVGAMNLFQAQGSTAHPQASLIPPNPSSHKPVAPKRQGKWCAMHVRIAWDIEKRKKEKPEKDSPVPNATSNTPNVASTTTSTIKMAKPPGSAPPQGPSPSNASQDNVLDRDRPLPLLSDKNVERQHVNESVAQFVSHQSTPSVIQNGNRESRPQSSASQGRVSHPGSVTTTPGPQQQHQRPHSTSRRSTDLQPPSTSSAHQLHISCATTPRLSTPNKQTQPHASFTPNMDPQGLLAMGLRPTFPQGQHLPGAATPNYSQALMDQYSMVMRQRQMEQIGQHNHERDELLRRQHALMAAGVSGGPRPGSSRAPTGMEMNMGQSLEMEMERQRLLHAMTYNPAMMDPLRLGGYPGGAAPGVPFMGQAMPQFMPNPSQMSMDSLLGRIPGLGVGGLPFSSMANAGGVLAMPQLFNNHPYANLAGAQKAAPNIFSSTLEHMARQKRDHLNGQPQPPDALNR